MIVAFLSLLAELALGAGLICAEARGQASEEQVAVARVVRNRVEASGTSGVGVMTAPHQFARPCPARRVRLDHAISYARGRWGEAPSWSLEATHFMARRVEPDVVEKWTKRGLERIDSGKTEHSFWR